MDIGPHANAQISSLKHWCCGLAIRIVERAYEIVVHLLLAQGFILAPTFLLC